MKNTFIAGVVLSLSLLPFSSVWADSDNHSAQRWEQAETLIETNISCDKLIEDQLELLGDYYMEQMHPGEQHESMDMMMGGEGSESLRQAHVFMARRWYCGDAAGMGMMGMMMGGQKVSGSEMMNEGSGRVPRMMGSGMMGDDRPMSSMGNVMTGFDVVGAGVTRGLVWIFLLVGIAAFGKYIFKK